MARLVNIGESSDVVGTKNKINSVVAVAALEDDDAAAKGKKKPYAKSKKTSIKHKFRTCITALFTSVNELKSRFQSNNFQKRI